MAFFIYFLSFSAYYSRYVKSQTGFQMNSFDLEYCLSGGVELKPDQDNCVCLYQKGLDAPLISASGHYNDGVISLAFHPYFERHIENCVPMLNVLIDLAEILKKLHVAPVSEEHIDGFFSSFERMKPFLLNFLLRYEIIPYENHEPVFIATGCSYARVLSSDHSMLVYGDNDNHKKENKLIAKQDGKKHFLADVVFHDNDYKEILFNSYSATAFFIWCINNLVWLESILVNNEREKQIISELNRIYEKM